MAETPGLSGQVQNFLFFPVFPFKKFFTLRISILPTNKERTASMKLYTIGYKGKKAEELFGILTENKVRKVIDVRLKNANNFCYYTHKRDFAFLLRLVGLEYEHKAEWAPEEWLFEGYSNKEIDWIRYVVEFRKIIEERNILRGLNAKDLDGCVLLCSEETANLCHRRLLAEYFQAKFQEIEVIHL